MKTIGIGLWTLIILGLGMNTAYTKEQTLFLLRHFEKEQHTKDPALTKEGLQRAFNLADFMRHYDIDYIFTSNYQRTKQSIEPLAQVTHKTAIVYDPRNLNTFAQLIHGLTGTIVIVGHSNTTPELLKLLGGPTITLDEDNYGTLFELQRTSSTQQAPTYLKFHIPRNGKVTQQYP
jgi:phosphohistidine phosphatase SixA